MEASSLYNSVIEMVEMTNRSVFVTGKAGTGKTTMLRKIVSRNFKRSVVVAPTGVAAINAEGMTIHSFFQMPFGPQLPTPQARHSLIVSQKIRKERLAIFREIELLIIDEISMVRADLLDAIDTVLRFYRHRPDLPFGGVQVVMFGDLYQLAPVVNEDEHQMLAQYYPTPYFFSSQVMADLKPVVVELDTIFRQTNSEFITLLNELRNNCISQHSLDMLASRYAPDYQLREGDNNILLTTHNLKADTVNLQQMARLRTKSRKYKAVIKDDFPEKSYPADEELELKVDARVMFIANDHQTPRRYFNGMIGVVKSLDEQSVTVSCEDGNRTIDVSPEVWANRSYHVDPKTNEIEESVLGTFSQIPLRLAWAITIHKSQGLTFDRVVIDSAAAFASGQVYVAFSRCRTLEGITLTSMVNQSSLRVNANVAAYCQTAMQTDAFVRQLDADRKEYCRQLIIDLFDLRPLYALSIDVRSVALAHQKSFKGDIASFADVLSSATSDISAVSSKFLNQLRNLPETELQSRVKAAAGYFIPLLDDLSAKITASHFTTDSRDNADNYLNRLRELLLLVAKKQFLMTQLADNFTVERYFDARQRFANPAFNVRAYAVESQYDDTELKNPRLFYALCRWRTEYCEEHNIPKFAMFPTQTLKDVAATLPTTKNQLQKIKGFGKTKIERFGDKCIEMVRQYSDANNITYDKGLEFIDEERDERPKLEQKTKKAKEPKVATLDITYQLLASGMSIDQVAKKRELRRDTIVNHLCQLITQHRLDGMKYVDADVVHFVAAQYVAHPDISLTDIYQKLSEAVPYDVLRIAKTCAEQN